MQYDDDDNKDDGGGSDSRSYKTCKAAVKLSPPANQYPVFYRPMPVQLPNQHCQSTVGISTETESVLQSTMYNI